MLLQATKSEEFSKTADLCVIKGVRDFLQLCNGASPIICLHSHCIVVPGKQLAVEGKRGGICLLLFCHASRLSPPCLFTGGYYAAA